LAKAGKTGEARKLQAELKEFAASRYVPSPPMAWISLGLGDNETALDELEQGFEEGSSQMIYLKADPVYDPLRDHPRFKELIGRMNLGA
jgi:serine/threonine-protein kinase